MTRHSLRIVTNGHKFTVQMYTHYDDTYEDDWVFLRNDGQPTHMRHIESNPNESESLYRDIMFSSYSAAALWIAHKFGEEALKNLCQWRVA